MSVTLNTALCGTQYQVRTTVVHDPLGFTGESPYPLMRTVGDFGFLPLKQLPGDAQGHDIAHCS